MTTYQTSFLSELAGGGKISAGTRAYFQDRLQNRLYNLVINNLIETQSQTPQFTQSNLSERISKRPEQVSRWLSSPGNWTLDTVSDLLLGICGGELDLSINKVSDQITCNTNWPKWLSNENTTAIETEYLPTTTSTSNVVQFIPKPVGTTMPNKYPFPSVEFGTV
jgi:hypothetical protein